MISTFEQAGRLAWDSSKQRKTWQRFGVAKFPVNLTKALQAYADEYAKAYDELSNSYATLVADLTKADDLETALKIQREGRWIQVVRQNELRGGLPRHLALRQQAYQNADSSGGGRDTQEAVYRAFKWLISHQNDDGSWSFDLTAEPCSGQCRKSCLLGKQDDRMGATAMALLPLLAHGFTHHEGPYKPQISKALAYMSAEVTRKGGKVYKDAGDVLSQAFATIAMSEAYDMSLDESFEGPTRAVFRELLKARSKDSGWARRSTDSAETITTAFALEALYSSCSMWRQQDPKDAQYGASAFLQAVSVDGGARYRESATGRDTVSASSSAAGLAATLLCGARKDNKAVQSGTVALSKTGPTADILLDYFATRVIHEMKGEIWFAWNSKMKALLLSTQSDNGHEAGSWYEGLDDGPLTKQYGRLWTTVLATLTLEIYYRYPTIAERQILTP